jgi:hypothetical protein
MKKHNLLVAGIGLALMLTACKKSDVLSPAAATETVAPATNATSDWKTISSWTAETKDKFSIYSGKSENSAVTPAVAANGLVLVYKKSGNSIMALPGEEKNGNSSYFWYYQVSEGNIEILADGYGAAKTPGNEQNFAYFILSADQLSALETKGHSKAELMTLSYESVSALLK